MLENQVGRWCKNTGWWSLAGCILYGAYLAWPSDGTRIPTGTSVFGLSEHTTIGDHGFLFSVLLNWAGIGWLSCIGLLALGEIIEQLQELNWRMKERDRREHEAQRQAASSKESNE